MKKFIAETLLGEVLKNHPRARRIMMNHGLFCFGCAYGESESLRNIADMHGIELEPLLKELNQELEPQ